MQSLWPTSGTVDEPLAWYPGTQTPTDGPAHAGARPFVRVNMIGTLDGAVAFSGRSGALGGPADQRLFMALRSQADLVLVGATTAREEHYGQVRMTPEVQRARESRGQAPLPAVAVVTRSGDLAGASRLFEEPGPRPIVITTGGLGAGRAQALAPVAELLEAGPPGGPVDLLSALELLAARGVRHVVCEGGPGLNTSLVASGTLDDLCLTLSPKLAGCVGGTLVGGWLGSGSAWLGATVPEGAAGAPGLPPLARLAELELAHVLEEDGFLFLRHLVRRPPVYSGGSVAPSEASLPAGTASGAP